MTSDITPANLSYYLVKKKEDNDIINKAVAFFETQIKKQLFKHFKEYNENRKKDEEDSKYNFYYYIKENCNNCRYSGEDILNFYESTIKQDPVIIAKIEEFVEQTITVKTDNKRQREEDETTPNSVKKKNRKKYVFDEEINKFENHLISLGKSKMTSQQYASNLRTIIRLNNIKSVQELKMINNNAVKQFINFYKHEIGENNDENESEDNISESEESDSEYDSGDESEKSMEENKNKKKLSKTNNESEDESEKSMEENKNKKKLSKTNKLTLSNT